MKKYLFSFIFLFLVLLSHSVDASREEFQSKSDWWKKIDRIINERVCDYSDYVVVNPLWYKKCLFDFKQHVDWFQEKTFLTSKQKVIINMIYDVVDYRLWVTDSYFIKSEWVIWKSYIFLGIEKFNISTGEIEALIPHDTEVEVLENMISYWINNNFLEEMYFTFIKQEWDNFILGYFDIQGGINYFIVDKQDLTIDYTNIRGYTVEEYYNHVLIYDQESIELCNIMLRECNTIFTSEEGEYIAYPYFEGWAKVFWNIYVEWDILYIPVYEYSEDDWELAFSYWSEARQKMVKEIYEVDLTLYK